MSLSIKHAVLDSPGINNPAEWRLECNGGMDWTGMEQ